MSDYLERLKTLEAASRTLDPTPASRDKMTDAVQNYASRFLDDIYDMPVYRPEGNGGRGLYDYPIDDDTIDIEKALSIITSEVDGPSLNPASGGHLGYIPGGGIYPSSLGDYIAAVTNRYSGVYFASPGAVRMEHLLVRWMCDLVGYGDGAGGDLTSGGSIANLIGVVTARDAHGLRGADFIRTVVYMTAHVHHAADKALRISGLGECIVRYVDMDERYRMRPDALAANIAADKAKGLLPWLVIASAGTTDTGAVDPMGDIADVAAQHDMWLHIDAAYGGFFLLCDEGRRALTGIDRGDSIVMDPHKGLFLPYGSGAVVVKDRMALQKAHAYHADYMQDADEANDEYSPADHSPELTRHFRGMRMWLPLKLLGLGPFRACLEEKLILARYFHEQISQADGFEAGPFPELSVVTYRYVPKRGDANEFNRRLVRVVQEDGRTFITSTLLDGVVTLRAAILCFRTHLDTVDYTLDVLQRKARELEDAS